MNSGHLDLNVVVRWLVRDAYCLGGRCQFDRSGSGCEAFSAPPSNLMLHVAVIDFVFFSACQFELLRLDVVVFRDFGPH